MALAYEPKMTYFEFKAWLEGYEAKGFGQHPVSYELDEIRNRLNRVQPSDALQGIANTALGSQAYSSKGSF